MIILPNGYRFDFCCAAGALGFDGRGYFWERPFARWIVPDGMAVVSKTLTPAPRRGNLRMYAPWRCVWTLPGLGTVNAVSLTNPGLFAWLEGPYRRAAGAGRHRNLAPSIKVESGYEACCVVSMLWGRVFPFIEVNGSCPNVPHADDDLASALGHLARNGSPLVLKLAADQVREDLIRAVDPHVTAYHAINAVPWADVHGDRPSPLGRHTGGLAGGVSGPAIRPIALEAVRRLRGMTVRPIVGGGGIFTLEDVRAFEAAGADAFALGTVFLHRPWRPRRIVRAYRAGRA